MRQEIKNAIDRLHRYQPSEGYYLGFSGGKDSCVIKQLAIESGVKFDAHYNVTTIDPPELIQFIRKHHSDVIWDRPEQPFLIKLVEKGFPLRQSRWCCRLYKEAGGDKRTVVLGIRAEESAKRANRGIVSTYNGKRCIYPILDWSSEAVWDFIKNRELPYCRLYDDGWHRIGCLFCPFSSRQQREKEIARYPRQLAAFRWAFNRLYDKRKKDGRTSVDRWQSGNEMFEWWLKHR